MTAHGDVAPGVARPLTGEAPRVETIPLGGSALARSVVAGNAPREWYETVPRGEGEWRARIEATARDGAAPMLGALAPALHGHGAATARLASVIAGQGVVVTIGQQPGLFGGPLYTLAKAISARALADVLQERCGVPVAPVFWAATDDADAAEAGTVAVATSSGAELLEAPPPDAPVGTPLCRAPLGDVGALFDRLLAAAGSATDVEPLATAREAYSPGATVGDAYVRLLVDVLSPLGVTVLDAGHAIVRERMAGVTDAALAGADAVAIALAARGDELRRHGHEPQVADVADLTLVFDWSQGPKSRIPVTRAMAARSLAPALRSPNVLLRPIAERAILPTVGYLAGPGELAYFAQVSAVADALGQQRPLALPRWSGEIVEPRVERALARLGVSRPELDDPDRAARLLAERALRPSEREALGGVRERIAELEANLLQLAREPGSLSEAAARGHAARFRFAAARLERRILAAAKRRERDAIALLAVAVGSVRPFGRIQERTLAFLPFVARYGSALLDAMLARAREHATRLVDG